MPDDKDAFIRQRRNLITFSIGLILIHLLDASFGTNAGQGNKFSIGLGFLSYPKDNGYILMIATWGGFFYFWWRFWIYGGREAQDMFASDFTHILQNHAKKYHEYIYELHKIDAETQLLKKDPLLNDPLRNDSNPIEYDEVMRETKPYRNFSDYHIRFEYQGKAKGKPFKESAVHSMKKLKEFKYTIPLYWKTITKLTAFSEYILPNILAILALLLGYSNLIKYLLE